MKSFVTCILSLLLLAVWMLGCGKPELMWVKPGGTDDAFNKDRYECAKESQQRVRESAIDHGIGSSSSVVMTNNELYSLCMQSRGWRLTEADTGSEPKDGSVTKSEQNQTDKKKLKHKSRIIASDDQFISYEDGTILDTKTKLMWAAKDNGSNINWSDAKKYCENYRGSAYTDWRMPTQDELATLYDASQSIPIPRFPERNMYVATKLINISSERIWSNKGGKLFNFANGKKESNLKFMALTIRALPVR